MQINRVRFNQRAVYRNLRRKGLNSKKARAKTQQYRKRSQVKASRHNKVQAQAQVKQQRAQQQAQLKQQKAQEQAERVKSLQSMATKVLGARVAYGAYQRFVKAPLSNLASLGRWK